MNPPEIGSYHFGKVVVDGVDYRKDLILLPGRVLGNWRQMEGHSLALEDQVLCQGEFDGYER